MTPTLGWWKDHDLDPSDWLEVPLDADDDDLEPAPPAEEGEAF